MGKNKKEITIKWENKRDNYLREKGKKRERKEKEKCKKKVTKKEK